jgi:hypothetical protein
MTDELEQGHAAVVASHSFPIEDARARAQASQRFDDQRKAAGEVVARPRIKPHAWTVLAGDDPEPVVLNLISQSTREQSASAGPRSVRRKPQPTMRAK